MTTEIDTATDRPAYWHTALACARGERPGTVLDAYASLSGPVVSQWQFCAAVDLCRRRLRWAADLESGDRLKVEGATRYLRETCPYGDITARQQAAEAERVVLSAKLDRCEAAIREHERQIDDLNHELRRLDRDGLSDSDAAATAAKASLKTVIRAMVALRDAERRITGDIESVEATLAEIEDEKLKP